MSNSEGTLPQNRLHSTTLYGLMEEADKKTCAYEYCGFAGYCNSAIMYGLEAVTDLQGDLINFDFNRCFERNLVQVFHWAFQHIYDRSLWPRGRSLTVDIDMNEVLSVWLEKWGDNPRIAAYILYYFVRFAGNEAASHWVSSCVDLAIKTGDPSLTDSLCWILGGGISCYPQLLEQAKDHSEHSKSVRKALINAGIFPPLRNEAQEIEQKHERLRKKATKTIFGAIRRNDLKAVEAILRKQPDLTARNNDGKTAEEYARMLEREEALNLIQTERYRYKLVNGHIIFMANDKTILFDIGSPSSIGYGEELTFAKTSFQLQQDYLDVPLDSLVEMAGFQFDVVMGPEILERFDVRIEPTENWISFGQKLTLPNEIEVPIDLFKRIPILKFNVAGNTVPLLFEPGARMSYINPDFVSGLKPSYEAVDFYPTYGKFRKPRYYLPTSLGDHKMLLIFGVLPDGLQRLLFPANVQGILGSDIFDNFSCMLSIRRRVISFSPLEGMHAAWTE